MAPVRKRAGAFAVRKTVGVVDKRHDRFGGSRTDAWNALQLPDGGMVFGESQQFFFNMPQLTREGFDFIKQQIPL